VKCAVDMSSDAKTHILSFINIGSTNKKLWGRVVHRQHGHSIIIILHVAANTAVL
jgi:hypothetical protein